MIRRYGIDHRYKDTWERLCDKSIIAIVLLLLHMLTDSKASNSEIIIHRSVNISIILIQI
jgi:hypothetical protein